MLHVYRGQLIKSKGKNSIDCECVSYFWRQFGLFWRLKITSNQSIKTMDQNNTTLPIHAYVPIIRPISLLYSHYIHIKLLDSIIYIHLIRPFIHTFMFWYLILSVRVFYCFRLDIPKSIGQIVSLTCLHQLHEHQIMYRSISLIDRFDNCLFRRQWTTLCPYC